MEKHTYLNRSNMEYIEGLYEQFKTKPESLSPEWRMFFEGVEFASDGGLGLSDKELDVYHLIMAYRDYGHFEANLDPLSNTTPPSDQLQLSRFNLKETDLDQKFQIGSIIGKTGATLREIIAFLRQTYCGKLTIQVAEALPEVRNWFIKEFEQNRDAFKLTADEKKHLFHSLTRGESLEKFIASRYVGKKRFSIEGADAILPMLETLASRALAKNVEELMIGMAHRGRINVLANFMDKGLGDIFAGFEGVYETDIPLEGYDGDVKYHLGYTSDKKYDKGTMRVSLAFNPSHLEAVDPVVQGMSRAAQRRRKDTATRKKVIPVLLHGDAAFAGQGVVAEIFQMSQVKGYTVGGTIHIVIDNQVGFTTNPENGRSSTYSTDLAKCLFTPVLHCNGDDVESCVRAMDIALRYRQEFGRDVVIDLICYRRFGHNEGDEPAFTQPQMYAIIRKHPTLREIYGKQLMRENVIDQKHYDDLYNEKIDNLQKILDDTRANPPKVKTFKFDGFWTGLRRAEAADFKKETNTKVDIKILKDICKMISEVPQGFTPHPKLAGDKGLLGNRARMAKGEQGIDWGTAELLAYGSLLTEGTSIRLTGQDCVRGTFTHRHAALYDQNTGEPYAALDNINPDKVEFCVYDSILSEYGVLGFEYGNAICDPTFLIMWEAQFGDFCNGAQIIIDQFLAAGESKWQQMNGMVLLLPHGYEGQGPEHSSARFERFLQLSAQNNMQVANLTTPAQIFHALRRQMKREFRKPLVIMSPKSLLRHPRAVSSLEDFANGTFQEVINDSSVKDPKKVETVVFVSGKLYYELLEEKEKRGDTADRTALVRLEQVYPFPDHKIEEIFKTYPKMKNLVWAQEEPQNAGAWSTVYFDFTTLLKKMKMKEMEIEYVGRTARASPATGSEYKHKIEQTAIINRTFEI